MELWKLDEFFGKALFGCWGDYKAGFVKIPPIPMSVFFVGEAC